jgi:protein-S-isoprenylcysteine O-methyltransferase Ste14
MNRSLTMNRFLAISYGAASYVAFLAAFVYAVGFVAATGVPRSVSHRLTAPPGQTVAVNVLLLGVFAVQHSVMARQAFKRWWTRFVPPAIERSTYVAVVKCRAISAVLAMANGPSSGVGRHVARGSAGTLALFWLGWAMALAATFLISHFDLFGLRQVYLACQGKPYTDLDFRVRLFVPTRAPPALARLPHRLLGRTDDDSGSSGLRRRHDRLHPAGHPAGRARPRRRTGRPIPRIPPRRADADTATTAADRPS